MKLIIPSGRRGNLESSMSHPKRLISCLGRFPEGILSRKSIRIHNLRKKKLLKRKSKNLRSKKLSKESWTISIRKSMK
jgi:hypothetical protein